MPQENVEVNRPHARRSRWRSREGAFAVVLGAALLAALLTDNRYVLGMAIVLVGTGGFIATFSGDDAAFRREMGNTSGPGWWVGWLISKAPGRSGRVFAFILSVGITALGIGALLGL